MKIRSTRKRKYDLTFQIKKKDSNLKLPSFLLDSDGVWQAFSFPVWMSDFCLSIGGQDPGPGILKIMKSSNSILFEVQ